MITGLQKKGQIQKWNFLGELSVWSMYHIPFSPTGYRISQTGTREEGVSKRRPNKKLVHTSPNTFLRSVTDRESNFSIFSKFDCISLLLYREKGNKTARVRKFM
jgi:hypothetical protein